MKSDYSKNVELICPVCGSTTFEYDTEKEDGKVTCISWKRVFTRDKLLEENQENLNANMEDLQIEVLKDTTKEIKNMMKKTFENNKNLKIKWVNMIVSDYIAICAVIVSLISIIVSIFLYNNQKKYIQTQDDLNQILLSKEKKQIESADEAIISANVVKMGNKILRIRIFNKGNGRANNVQISYPQDHNWLIKDDILPLEFLDSG